MPIYDYKCDECGNTEEHLQDMGAPSPDCSSCLKKQKKVSMKKVISKTSFVLKGNHWAKDNYGLQDKV